MIQATKCLHCSDPPAPHQLLCSPCRSKYDKSRREVKNEKARAAYARSKEARRPCPPPPASLDNTWRRTPGDIEVEITRLRAKLAKLDAEHLATGDLSIGTRKGHIRRDIESFEKELQREQSRSLVPA